MAFYCLGKCLFSDSLVGLSTGCYKCSTCVAFNALCPWLYCCFGDVKKLIDAAMKAGVYTSTTFTSDPFYKMAKALTDDHGKQVFREAIKKKYGLPRGTKESGVYVKDPNDMFDGETKALGMLDTKVRNMFKEVDDMAWKSFWADCCMALKWTTPVACNAMCWVCCCCCQDLTHLRAKVETGEAYQVGCCGPFFTEPLVQVLPPPPTVGRHEELVVILSSPGDTHARLVGLTWPVDLATNPCMVIKRQKKGDPDEPPAWGNLHTTFQGLADQSKETVAFCPVQMLDATARDKWVYMADARYKDLDLWKAYWLAAIKLATGKGIHERHEMQQIKYVAILGGGKGAIFERKKIEDMAKLISNRKKIEEIITAGIQALSCCMTCGLQEHCCKGWASSMYLIDLSMNRLGFCLPFKNPPMEFYYSLPDELEPYLLRTSDELLREAGGPQGRRDKVSAYDTSVTDLQQAWAKEDAEAEEERKKGLTAEQLRAELVANPPQMEAEERAMRDLKGLP